MESINLSEGRVIIDSSSSFNDGELSLVKLVESSRFSFLPLELVSRYGISRLIDSRNCYELFQRGFVIPQKKNAATHEQIRTIEDIVENDKGGMIISPFAKKRGMCFFTIAVSKNGAYSKSR